MKKQLLVATLTSSLFTTAVNADIIDFNFTGRLIVVDPTDYVLFNNGLPYSPISATLSYDTVSGIGSSGLSITMNGADFLGTPPTFHDITMNRIAGTDTIEGQVLVDWSGTDDMPLHIEWDATGLFNAINHGTGLQVGHVLSGSDLYFDSNNNGIQDSGEFVADISSVTPYSDSLVLASHGSGYEQGAAPLAATANSLGLDASTPFPGFRGYFDIGSGNSMHVTAVSASVVPVPAAVWLFASGLLSLVSFARRR